MGVGTVILQEVDGRREDTVESLGEEIERNLTGHASSSIVTTGHTHSHLRSTYHTHLNTDIISKDGEESIFNLYSGVRGHVQNFVFQE